VARALTPAELRELLGAYALDAVDGDEREQVERWLTRDGDASRDADELRETASLLVHAIVEPTPDLWTRIEERLGDASDGAAPNVAPPRLGSVAGLDDHRARAGAGRPRRQWLVGIAAAVAMVVAVGVGVVAGTRLADQDAQIEQLAAGMEDGSMARAALAASMEDGARTVDLVAPDDATMAQVVVTRDGQGYFVTEALPVLPEGRTYQLWAMADDDPATPAVSVGVLGRRPSVTAFRADAGVGGFAVTDERVPGAVRTDRTDKIEGWFA
jgi:hypothetical protein